MNILSAVYAYFFQESVNRNAPNTTDPVTANIVLSCCMAMLMCSVVGMLIVLVPEAADTFEDLINDVFGRTAGKTIAKLILLPLLGLIYPAIRYTIGTPKNYQRIIGEYESLPESQREAIVNKGKVFLYVGLFSLFIPMGIGAVLSLF